MTHEEFEIARLFVLENHSLIAAGRLQRWDVAKWGVTVNLALATASSSLRDSRGLFCFFCLLVAVLGAGLIHYYNGRIGWAREGAQRSLTYLKANAVDLKAITGSDQDVTVAVTYDFQALIVFGGILGFSIVPAFLVWVMG
jgi:hypothetical protein